MNDAQIRQGFHRKVLQRYHTCTDTLVVDELGLKHGKCRADIAVINGYLNGFEIKSDKDSLYRLSEQVAIYNLVFDRVTAVVTKRHVESVQEILPEWWGIVVCYRGPRGAVKFCTKRKSTLNRNVDAFSVAQLLWSEEARETLSKMGVSPRILRKNRSVLYRHLADLLSMSELRRIIRNSLMARTDWRCPSAPLPGDDLSPLSARS